MSETGGNKSSSLEVDLRLIEELFHRYDTDESGTIDCDDELRMLTTNICYRVGVTEDLSLAIVQLGSDFSLTPVKYKTWLEDALADMHESSDTKHLASLDAQRSSTADRNDSQVCVSVHPDIYTGIPYEEPVLQHNKTGTEHTKHSSFLATCLNDLRSADEMQEAETWESLMLVLEQLLAEKAWNDELHDGQMVRHAEHGEGTIVHVQLQQETLPMAHFKIGESGALFLPAKGLDLKIVRVSSALLVQLLLCITFLSSVLIS